MRVKLGTTSVSARSSRIVRTSGTLRLRSVLCIGSWDPRCSAVRRIYLGTHAVRVRSRESMSVLREIVEVSQEPEVAFDAVADFSSSARWDPGVVAAERVGDGETAPSGVGAVYRLTVMFRGRASEMTYRTTEYRRPDRVVLEGVGPRIDGNRHDRVREHRRGRHTHHVRRRSSVDGPREVGGAIPRSLVRRDGQACARWHEGVVRRASRAPGMIMSGTVRRDGEPLADRRRSPICSRSRCPRSAPGSAATASPLRLGPAASIADTPARRWNSCGRCVTRSRMDTRRRRRSR